MKAQDRAMGITNDRCFKAHSQISKYVQKCAPKSMFKLSTKGWKFKWNNID